MRGFTIIEVLIVLSIVAILSGISLPVYKIMQQKNDLKMAGYVTVSAMRRAQILAQAAKEDSSWGIHIENSQVIVFKGSNYANRNTSRDENFVVPSHISTGGLTDIIFDKLTGMPQSIGLITFSISNDSINIIINEKGAIEY